MTWPVPSDVTEIDNPEMAQRRWAQDARYQLRVLTEAVAQLRGSLETPATPATQREPLAAAVTDACAVLTQWLQSTRAPRGLRKAEGELGATAGVYRNAAVAFGSLNDADPNQFEARYQAYSKLLQQGDHHIEIFFDLLRKKVGF
jgi:hypothetical protein